LLATTAALSLGAQNAWALCSDGTIMPAGGFVVGRDSQVLTANNWSPGIFTSSEGSLFVPDASVNENNDPALPLTGGGHNWVFDQGSTLCKVTDLGGGGAPATGWSTAGIKGGLFSISLDNVGAPVKGGDAGKTAGPANYYSDIPEGLKLTSGAVSPDGMFAMATSIRRFNPVYACLNPLGDPGDPLKAITLKTVQNWANTNQGSLVKCMIVGNNNLAQDATTVFGPDKQPYFGGQRVVNSFNSQPGGTNLVAWPQCTATAQLGGKLPKTAAALMTAMQAAFNGHQANGCGNAQPNFGYTSALITQPAGIAVHHGADGNDYVYTGPVGGTVVQFKVTVDPISGLSNYQFRTVLTGTSLSTGIGVADDLTYSNLNGGVGGSLMVMSDPSAIGASGQEAITRMPLCEDMQ
jgi:hypothetical protein